MQLKWVPAAAIAGLLSVSCSNSLGLSQTRPAVYTADQLRFGIREAQQRIKSYRLVYRASGYDPAKYPKNMYYHSEIVVKSPYCVFHRSGHGYDDFDWRDEPTRQVTYVTKDCLYSEYPFSRTYAERSLQPAAAVPGSLIYELSFLALGIWPLAGREAIRPLGRPYVLRELVEVDDGWKVREEQELVDGHWCHVLDHAGEDILWIDAERDFTLLMREAFLSAEGPLTRRYQMSGHKEVCPGVWLPSQIRNTQFDFYSTTAEGRRRKVIDSTIDITGLLQTC